MLLPPHPKHFPPLLHPYIISPSPLSDLTKITPLKKRPQMLLQFDTLVIRAVDGQVVVSGEGEVYLKQGGMLIGESVMEGGVGEDEDDLR